jgi:hypothetical protein
LDGSPGKGIAGGIERGEKSNPIAPSGQSVQKPVGTGKQEEKEPQLPAGGIEGVVLPKSHPNHGQTQEEGK